MYPSDTIAISIIIPIFFIIIIIVIIIIIIIQIRPPGNPRISVQESTKRVMRTYAIPGIECNWGRPGRAMLMATRTLCIIVRIKRIRNFSELHLPKLYRVRNLIYNGHLLRENSKKSRLLPFLLQPSILITHSYLFHFWNADVKNFLFSIFNTRTKPLAARFLLIVFLV